MGYVLGFDGGGTKSDCAVFDREGRLAALARFGCTNHEQFSGGMDALRPLLLQMISDVLAKAGIQPGEVDYAVFGMAGVDVSSQKRGMEAILSQVGFSGFLACNDAYLGVKAALPEGVGCCMVNGTGNTVAGIDPTGATLQVGGMGAMLGERGGGWFTSACALRAVYDELFRLGPATGLTPRVLEILESRGREDFVERVYASYLGDGYSYTPILQALFACGNEGDPVAAGLLEWQGREFARSLAGCILNLHFGERADVALVGSVTLKASCPIAIDAMKAELPKLSGKTHRFFPLSSPPVAGAVLWAMENAWGKERASALRERVLRSLENASL